jgi:hypothetical protein
MFQYSIKKMEKIIPSNVMQSSFVKLGEGATDTYEKIQKAFGNDSVSHAEVFQCH